jgi:hypothetical protein
MDDPQSLKQQIQTTLLAGRDDNLATLVTALGRVAAADFPALHDVLNMLDVADADDDNVAQADGFPVYGFRPTTSWRAGEVIVGERPLSLPESAQAGSYRLWIGFYDLESEQRLPVTVDGKRQADDRLLLAPLVIAHD